MKIKDMCIYRSVWMGIAMLLIILFHSGLNLHCPILNGIKTFGYGGVDIFIFAAGIGSYCSYLRDKSPLHYLQRRILRLAPVYLPFIVVWITAKLYMKQIKPFSIVGNLLRIQGFTSNGYEFNWFLTGIVICYLLTPYLASYIQEKNMKQNILLIVFLLLVSFVFWNDKKIIISISRLPIYALGMIFSKNNKIIITKKIMLCELSAFLVGIIFLISAYKFANSSLWNYGLWWYPFILIVPFLCYLISFVSELFQRNKIGIKIVDVISIIGSYSFELYLVHIFVFDLTWNWLANNKIGHQNIIWILSITLVIPCVVVLRLISNFVKNYIYNTAKIS